MSGTVGESAGMKRKVHFMYRTWGEAQRSGLGALSPCNTVFVWRSGTPLKRWTTDPSQVTCKRCTATIARLTVQALA